MSKVEHDPALVRWLENILIFVAKEEHAGDGLAEEIIEEIAKAVRAWDTEHTSSEIGDCEVIDGIGVCRHIAMCPEGARLLEDWRQRYAAEEHAEPSEADLISRIRALHQPFAIYDDCGHKHEVAGGDVVEIDEIGLTCEKMYEVCRACCIDSGSQSEECAAYHKHGPEVPICPTAAILRDAVKGEPRGE